MRILVTNYFVFKGIGITKVACSGYDRPSGAVVVVIDIQYCCTVVPQYLSTVDHDSQANRNHDDDLVMILKQCHHDATWQYQPDATWQYYHDASVLGNNIVIRDATVHGNVIMMLQGNTIL